MTVLILNLDTHEFLENPFFWENISARQMYDDHSVYVALHLTLGKLEKPSLDVVKNLDVENWILEPFLC